MCYSRFNLLSATGMFCRHWWIDVILAALIAGLGDNSWHSELMNFWSDVQIPTGDENSYFQRGGYVFFFFKGHLTCKWGKHLEIDCFLILTPLQNCITAEEPQRKKPWPLPPSWTTGESTARNVNKAPLAVRGSASLCVATGLGLMTTGDARSPKLLVARKHLRCYIGKPSFSTSFFQKTPEVSKLWYAFKYLLSYAGYRYLQ